MDGYSNEKHGRRNDDFSGNSGYDKYGAPTQVSGGQNQMQRRTDEFDGINNSQGYGSTGYGNLESSYGGQQQPHRQTYDNFANPQHGGDQFGIAQTEDYNSTYGNQHQQQGHRQPFDNLAANPQRGDHFGTAQTEAYNSIYINQQGHGTESKLNRTGSSSSSSEDDGEGGRRKKGGIKEKIKSKLPGHREQQY